MKHAKVGAFDIFNVGIMLVLLFLTLAPFWFTLVGSFNEGLDFTRGGVYIWPRKFSILNYRFVLSDSQIVQAFVISVSRTVIGTVTSILFTAVAAYGMSSKALKGKPVYWTLMIITMFFGGGLIPSYVLLNGLGLINNYFVYIIPGLFSVYTLLIFQTNFREIPASIAESARIDGASEYRILFRLVLPMSLPVIATMSLFAAVGHWNSYMDSMLFTSKDSLQTIQYYLQRIISKSTFAQNVATRAAQAVPIEQRSTVSAQTIILAAMVVTTVPILTVYPFAQKYFLKGIMIGAIKG
jgi:putative aldouronate transport system permease protein